MYGTLLRTTADPDDLRRQADEIVSRPEFQEAQPSLVERALDWLFEQLGDLIGPVAGSGGYAVGYAILIVALAAIGYLLWRVFPRGRLGPQRQDFTVVTDTVTRPDTGRVACGGGAGGSRWRLGARRTCPLLRHRCRPRRRRPTAERTVDDHR